MAEKLEYKDGFTLDGRVRPKLGVTKTKVAAVKKLTEAVMYGDRVAKGKLEESLTTSDAIFNFAHLVNVNVLEQFPLAPRVWTDIAGTKPVSDFKPATLYSLVPEWKDNGVLGTGTPRHIAPPIPEGHAYPYATLSGEESLQGGVIKRGFKVGFTFEAFINDSVGFIQALPEAMRQVALDTEEYEIFNALVSGVDSDQQLIGGVTPDGTTVVANAPFSREALVEAIIELSNREVNGRKVRVTGGYNLVVPVGEGIFVNFVLNQTFAQVQDGSFIFNINGYNPLAGVSVIESEYVTGSNWYLLPKKGGFGGRPVLDLLQLTGHELPELRVENATGTYIGGASVSPFEGSFDNDSADFRVRTINHGVLWSPDAVIWSTGAGS